jgi:hypothetical protein
MTPRSLPAWLAIAAVTLVSLASPGEARAARNYTATQTPAVGAQFDMGTTQPISYLIANTSGGAQVGERIYYISFRLSGGSTFSSSTAAPAGWTRTTFTTTEVAFTATSWANAIAAGGSLTFTPVVVMQSGGSNVNENLRDIRANFTDTTTGPPFNNQGTGPINNAGGWTLGVLAITSFIITDTLGNPITALLAGGTFRLVMTVKNTSTVVQNPVVSNPNPPTAIKTGTVTQGLTGTAGSPLNLAAGASGTITFTYTTVATDSGTIYFNARAFRTATANSAFANSSILAVGRYVVSVTPSLTCQYVGSNFTVTLGLMNSYPFTILNANPTLTPLAGSPVTLIAGPAPTVPIASIPIGTTNVVYTYQVNATGTTSPFRFNASATGNLNTAGTPALTTPVSTSAWVSRGNFSASINPTVVNAGSTNVELTVTVTNNGCAAVASVGITPGAGWAGAGDTYSLVDQAVGVPTEGWTAAGGAAVTFTAPSIATRMPLAAGGEFAVVYASTPPAATASVFTVRVTDANGLFSDIPLTVTVNAFKAGTLNDAAGRVWREEFR